MPRSQRTHNTTRIVQSIFVPVKTTRVCTASGVPEMASGAFPGKRMLGCSNPHVCSLQHTSPLLQSVGDECVKGALFNGRGSLRGALVQSPNGTGIRREAR